MVHTESQSTVQIRRPSAESEEAYDLRLAHLHLRNFAKSFVISDRALGTLKFTGTFTHAGMSQ